MHYNTYELQRFYLCLIMRALTVTDWIAAATGEVSEAGE